MNVRAMVRGAAFAAAVATGTNAFADDLAVEDGERTQPKPVASTSSVGGHLGVATPYLAVSNKTDVIGKDKFLTVATPIGVTVRGSGKWAFDFEVIVTNSVLKKETTGLIIDPGVIYNFGPVAAGLRAAYQIGGDPNIGVIPLVNKGFKVGSLTWFVEAAFPTFVKSGDVTLNAVAHTGLAF